MQYILTLISDKHIEQKLEDIAHDLRAYKIVTTDSRHLNPEFSEGDRFADAWHIACQGDLSDIDSKRITQAISKTHALDACIQTADIANTPKKLVCFDMDSTLIQHEVMDELAFNYGIGEEISAITESAMRGEISFKQSFEQRLACLKGFDASRMPDIAKTLKLMPGAITLIKTLRASGVKIVILSGGFKNFATHLQKELGEMDAIHANVLEVNNGKLTGKISNQIIDETGKLTIIKALEKQYGLTTNQSIAVGDGANDIPMITYAGLGVAYHAKPIVQEKAAHCINHTDLSSILYLLGYTQAEFE